MKRYALVILIGVFLLILAACAPAAETPVATQAVTPMAAVAVTPESAASPVTTLPSDRSLRMDQNDLFATAGTCNTCHQDLRDKNGRDISPAENWRGTMMANAAVDPYYLASVSMEVAMAPEHAAAIENKCATCHMAMAHFTDQAAGQDSLMFGENGYLAPDHPLHQLAVDGVSCAVCHQIPDNPNAQRQSGDMAFDLTTPRGDRTLYGPFPMDETSQLIMRSGSGFVPVQSQHMRQSALCATCHELYIQPLSADGSTSDALFPEQTPYAEWLNSDYADQQSCQACHMDRIQGKTAISNLTAANTYGHFSVHNFHGSNVYMLNILKTFGDEIGVQATDENFDAVIARSTQMLQNETAALQVTAPQKTDDGSLRFDVIIQPKTGHKFPTSFPSRRAWLHVTVKDAAGQVIFESGALGADGQILGNANDESPESYEPHYDLITDPDQVQIYESIMRLPDNQVTTSQMFAVGYIKDNRLLPAGFDKQTDNPYIAVLGAAAADDNFIGGQDTVTYQIDPGDASGPFTVEVALLYQSISYRWAQNLNEYPTDRVDDFMRYYQAVDNQPVTIAIQTVSSR